MSLLERLRAALRPARPAAEPTPQRCTDPECQGMSSYYEGLRDAWFLASATTRSRAIGHADARWVPMMQLADELQSRAEQARDAADVCWFPGAPGHLPREVRA